MYIDVSLNPLAFRSRVSRVLWQQGRVTLDSDLNEQTSTVLHYLRALGADIIGPHGGRGPSFYVSGSTPDDLRIAYGIYYVDGIRCENLPDGFDLFKAGHIEANRHLLDGRLVTAQPNLTVTEADLEKVLGKPVVVYLDVWERDITSAQDDSIREVALGTADTAARAEIVWQVRVEPADTELLDRVREEVTSYLKPLATATFLGDAERITPYVILNASKRSSALLLAAASGSNDTNPCVVSPAARYRGTENQLYRVEIHDSDEGKKPTFKWTTDGGSTVFPIKRFQGRTIVVESLGRDDRTTLTTQHWVEVVDDDSVLGGKPNRLLKVQSVDARRMEITVGSDPVADPVRSLTRRPVLRRWEEDVRPITLNQPAKLEAGIDVTFSKAEFPLGGFRSGDYWLIPARTATGSIIWNGAQPPHGVEHHYAPLAVWTGKAFVDLRRVFDDYAQPPRHDTLGTDTGTIRPTDIGPQPSKDTLPADKKKKPK